MICVLPLSPLDKAAIDQLHSIYTRCQRADLYEDPKYARNLNVFIDDEGDFSWIVENVLQKYGIDAEDLDNFYKEQRCNGINFNVLTSNDWVHDHKDYNPAKLNILVTPDTACNIFFVDDHESWYYHTPAILDVSKKHRVENLWKLTEPRVMLQAFLNKPFSHYRRMIEQRNAR